MVEFQNNHSVTVLVGDDENTIQGVIRQMLEAKGYKVPSASGVRDGVREFREHSEEILVVLLDYSMPVLDGEALSMN